MAGRGGYQAPSRPAPVSGVGKNSRRTDGGPVQSLRHLPDAQYGEDKTYYDEQRTAPLAAAPQAPTPPPPSAGVPAAPSGPDMSQLVPLSAPSMRPDEPVTHGAALGPGAGPEVLNLPSAQATAQQSAAQYLQQLAARSANPAAQYLAQKAQGSF